MAKLGLYERRGVLEYWVVDWRLRQIDVYRRAGTVPGLATSLQIADTLTSPRLPGFSLSLSELLGRLPDFVVAAED